MRILPAKRLAGTVRVPGDKSVSHRAIMLSSIAKGETRVANFAASQDCMTTVECMRALGVRIEVDGTDVTVQGVGKNGLQRPAKPLDCGNSGTTMRLLAGMLVGQPFDSVLVGDESLQKRPMSRIIEPLGKMGAVINSTDGRPPLRIKGGHVLKGIRYETRVPSAQVKSAVLLAGIYAEGETTVSEPTPTRDHTERMLAWLGRDLNARPIHVPGDLSSAAYFLIAAACLRGSEVMLEAVGTNPTRTRLLDILLNAGIMVDISQTREENNEPLADLRVRASELSPKTLHLAGDVVAEVIDEIPVLAILGTQLPGGLEVRDARELRVKESDRIAATVTNLKRMNADVTEYEDGFSVERSQLREAAVDSFGDHRIAMAFAVAGLLAKGQTEVVGADCAAISYPNFFRDLDALIQQ